MTVETSIPVSLGEALDKLSILEIKLERITDPSRSSDVRREHEALLESLKDQVGSYPYHYRILKEINYAIWNLQDSFHGKNPNTEEGMKLCSDILIENDRRFRVKSKINTLANSSLSERKGYATKRAFVCHHLGMGDMIWMNGAVRYLATAYDEVLVVCKEVNQHNTKAMYADDPSITFHIIHDDLDLNPWPDRLQTFKSQGYDSFTCGNFALRDDRSVKDVPNSFYDHLNLKREIRTNYFYIPPSEAAITLAQTLKTVPYIVVHEEASHTTLPIVASLRAAGEKRLILDINKNHYEHAHPWHHIAQHAVNKPLLDYSALLMGAQELHLIESSLYCLASHLDLSHVSRKVCYLPWGGNAERLGVFETGYVKG